MSKNRQLAAIMFTHIEGYTSLMQQDENKAIQLRQRHRDIFEITTDAFKGEIIQYFGDGTLSIFSSTVEAVDCAIELQQSFIKDPSIPVRIGIHVGDILRSKGDIIGDAVNIASRIESCAIPGSILISDKVHDQVRSHRHIDTEFLDVYDLKNVEIAMPIYAISKSGLVVPNKEDVKSKLGKNNVDRVHKVKSYKKTTRILAVALLLVILTIAYFQFFKAERVAVDNSIAVLPFDNLSTDDDSEIFRDGMTEDILTYLSKLKQLHVISRTSVMQYKETKKTIPEIAKELGVTYILEGSIRKYGDKIRVTAQLIDAKNDEHIWAENYDKTLTDIFELQSEVSQEIVDALHLNIDFEEQQSLKIIPTKNIDAYQLVIRGKREADKRTRESIAKSIGLYKEAIILDPNYAEAYAEIANSIYLETYYSGRDHIEASKTANDYLNKAEKINDKVSRIHSVKGLIYTIEGKHDLALSAFQRAIKLSPNDLTARHQFATYYFYTKNFDKQLEQAEIAYSLDPLSFATANSYFNALQVNYKYEEAENLLKKLETIGDKKDKEVIDISYFRLFIDQKNYEKAIAPLEKIVKTRNVFNRFLGYCYAKTGDTISAYRIIDSIRKKASKREKSHQLAMVYSGLKITDSVLYYLDTIRNKQTRTFRRERKDFFNYLKDNAEFQNVLKEHGIKPVK